MLAEVPINNSMSARSRRPIGVDISMVLRSCGTSISRKLSRSNPLRDCMGLQPPIDQIRLPAFSSMSVVLCVGHGRVPYCSSSFPRMFKNHLLLLQRIHKDAKKCNGAPYAPRAGRPTAPGEPIVTAQIPGRVDVEWTRAITSRGVHPIIDLSIAALYVNEPDACGPTLDHTQGRESRVVLQLRVWPGNLQGATPFACFIRRTVLPERAGRTRSLGGNVPPPQATSVLRPLPPSLLAGRVLPPCVATGWCGGDGAVTTWWRVRGDVIGDRRMTPSRAVSRSRSSA